VEGEKLDQKRTQSGATSSGKDSHGGKRLCLGEGKGKEEGYTII